MTDFAHSNPFRLADRKRPTKAHRPAIWENMLGTVFAMNDEREIRYFGRYFDAALEFADVRPEREPRLGRRNVMPNARYARSGAVVREPRPSQLVLWVR